MVLWILNNGWLDIVEMQLLQTFTQLDPFIKELVLYNKAV